MSDDTTKNTTQPGGATPPENPDQLNNPDGEQKLEGSTTTPPADGADEPDDDELLAMRGKIQEKIDDKNKEDNAPKYTQRDMDNVLKKMDAILTRKQDTEDNDYIDLLDPSKVKRRFVRLMRLNDKFIIGLKDMNTDSYSDTPVFVQNIENPNKKGEFIPWSTLVYEDGTTELYPYLSMMKRTVGVWAEIIDKKVDDISETFGVVEVKAPDESNEWNLKGTGRKVLAKALKQHVTYVCKEIKKGATLNVDEQVVNKVEAPYGELKKFLEETE